MQEARRTRLKINKKYFKEYSAFLSEKRLVKNDLQKLSLANLMDERVLNGIYFWSSLNDVTL